MNTVLLFIIWAAGFGAFFPVSAAVCRRPCGVRALGGFLAILCFHKSRSLPECLTLFAFLEMLAMTACVDAKTMEIPDCLNGALFLIGAVSVITVQEPSVFDRIVGIASASAPLLLMALTVPGSFGGGDIKLMGACGLFLGWKRSLVALFLAVLTGGAYGVWLLLTGRKGRKDHFAFGPFLCLGMFLALFWSEELLSAYLRLCGLY